MNLRAFLTILWRRKYVFTLTVVIAVAVAFVGSTMTAPVYIGSAKLHVATALRGSLGFVDYDTNYADRLMNTYTYIANSGPMLNELMLRFDLEAPPVVSVEAIANTELMVVQVEADTPTLARDLTNALAAQLVIKSEELSIKNADIALRSLEEKLNEIESSVIDARKVYESLQSKAGQAGDDKTVANRLEELLKNSDQFMDLKLSTYNTLLEQSEQLRILEIVQANSLSVVDPAGIPDKPLRPNKLFNLLLALVLGIVGGLGLAFLFENFDNRLHSIPDIEAAIQLPILGRISAIAKFKWPRVLYQRYSDQEEAFARTCTNILAQIRKQKIPQSLLVTSAEKGEGKSTIAANLAVALAQTGRQVILVDANFRHPAIHEIFGLPNQFGVVDILRHQIPLEKAIHATSLPTLKIITSGMLIQHPATLLTSEHLTEFVEDLKDQADVILVDTPAFLAVTDTMLLTAMADAILLVVGRTVAHENAVKVVKQELGNALAPILGLIINRAGETDHYRSFEYLQPAATPVGGLLPMNGHRPSNNGDQVRPLIPS